MNYRKVRHVKSFDCVKQNNAIEKKQALRSLCSNLIMPSSAALQKVLGHMGAVAMRLTLLV